MRQRTRLAQAIAHDPDLLILDEPLTGLDPVARRQTMDLFQELADAGKSLVVSSHVLHEVQSLTDSIVLLNRGRLQAQGTVQDIRAELSFHPREVLLIAHHARPLAVAMMNRPHVRSVELIDEHHLVLRTRRLDAFYEELASVVKELQPGLRSMKSSDANLDSVFDFLIK